MFWKQRNQSTTWLEAEVQFYPWFSRIRLFSFDFSSKIRKQTKLRGALRFVPFIEKYPKCLTNRLTKNLVVWFYRFLMSSFGHSRVSSTKKMKLISTLIDNMAVDDR